MIFAVLEVFKEMPAVVNVRIVPLDFGQMLVKLTVRFVRQAVTVGEIKKISVISE